MVLDRQPEVLEPTIKTTKTLLEHSRQIRPPDSVPQQTLGDFRLDLQPALNQALLNRHLDLVDLLLAEDLGKQIKVRVRLVKQRQQVQRHSGRVLHRQVSVKQQRLNHQHRHPHLEEPHPALGSVHQRQLLRLANLRPHPLEYLANLRRRAPLHLVSQLLIIQLDLDKLEICLVHQLPLLLLHLARLRQLVHLRSVKQEPLQQRQHRLGICLAHQVPVLHHRLASQLLLVVHSHLVKQELLQHLRPFLELNQQHHLLRLLSVSLNRKLRRQVRQNHFHLVLQRAARQLLQQPQQLQVPPLLMLLNLLTPPHNQPQLLPPTYLATLISPLVPLQIYSAALPQNHHHCLLGPQRLLPPLTNQN